MTLEIFQDNQEDLWQELVEQVGRVDYLQSRAWAKVKEASGWSAQRVGFYDSSHKPAGYCYILRRSILKGKFKIAYSSRGPIFRQDLSSRQMSKMLELLTKELRLQRVDDFLIDPLIDTNLPLATNFVTALKEAGFNKQKHFVQRPNTALKDLTDYSNLEELIASMNSTRRRLTRKLIRQGLIEVEISKQDSDRSYQQVHEVTAKSKGFTPRSFDYNQRVVSSFNDSGEPTSAAFVVKAVDKTSGQVVAGAIITCYGQTATYYSGGSVNERGLSEASTLVQLYAMDHARSLGYHIYDLSGAPQDLDDANDPFAKVWIFKKSLNVKPLISTGCWGIQLSPKGKVFTQARNLRSLLAKVRQ